MNPFYATLKTHFETLLSFLEILTKERKVSSERAISLVMLVAFPTCFVKKLGGFENKIILRMTYNDNNQTSSYVLIK